MILCYVVNFYIYLHIYELDIYISSLMSSMYDIVTEQTRARPHGALTHDTTVNAEGNRFLFAGFQPWAGR